MTLRRCVLKKKKVSWNTDMIQWPKNIFEPVTFT